MKKWFQKLNSNLENMSYPKRLAFHLPIYALCLLLIWLCSGYALPTAEQEFRRMERTNLLPPGEIVFAANEKSGDLLYTSWSDRSVYALDGTELHLRDRWFVSLGESHAAVGRVENADWDRDLWWVPLEESGPTLLPFQVGGYDGSGYWATVDYSYVTAYTYYNFFSLLLVNVPAEAARVEITVEQEGISTTGPGWDMGGGVWLLTPDDSLPYDPNIKRTYTYRLFRADSSLLLERSGIIEGHY